MAMAMMTVIKISCSEAPDGIEATMAADRTAMITEGASWIPEIVPGKDVKRATTTPLIVAARRANPIPVAMELEISPVKIKAAKDMAIITSTRPITSPDVNPCRMCADFISLDNSTAKSLMENLLGVNITDQTFRHIHQTHASSKEI